MERVITTSGRLDFVLAKELSVSRALVSENILKGNVQVNGARILKPSHKVSEGDKVTYEITFEKSALKPIEARLEILFEDPHLLAINKPQGMIVHPATSFNGATLVHHILHHLSSDLDLSTGRPGIVHRLDRGTSGVIVIAKTRSALDLLSKQFKERVVEKTYECIVWGNPAEQGSYTQSMGRSPIDPRRMSLKAKRNRTAVTEWKRVRQFLHFAHLLVMPKTGRTHQIRVHLSENGYPILGDELYRRPGIIRRAELSPELSSIIENAHNTFLHAKTLRLLHPIDQRPMTIEAKRPENFDKMLELLARFDQSPKGSVPVG